MNLTKPTTAGWLFPGLILAISLLPLKTQPQTVYSLRREVQRIMAENNKRMEKKQQLPASFSADTARVMYLVRKGRSFQSENYDSLLFYSQKALNLALKTADLNSISAAVQLQGRYYMMKENYKDATATFLLSLAIEEKLKNRARVADLHDELGTVYYYQEIFAKATSCRTLL